MSLKSGSIQSGVTRFEKKLKNPHSAKYANVEGVVDSGQTIAKVAPAATDRQIVRMRNEIYKRVSVAKLAEALKARVVHESIFALAGDNCRDTASVTPSLCSKITTTTVVSVHANDSQPLKTADDIMVLDVRPREMYQQCHLQYAVSYEKKRLTQDQISAELWTFKQSTSKKLVVYDVDDKTTGEVATLLVNKGWENVYALTGGLEEVAATYAEILEGDVGKVRSAPSPTRSVRVPSGRPGSAGSARTKSTVTTHGWR